MTGIVTGGVSTLLSTLIGKTDPNLATSADYSFQYQSLSNSQLIRKHSDALCRSFSSVKFHEILNHLVYDWDSNHRGLEARRCIALGILNNSRHPIVIKSKLNDGAELYNLPQNRQQLFGVATGVSHSNEWSPDRSMIVFAWGYTPTLLTTGDVYVQVQSNAFNVYITRNSTRLVPNPGYSATFTTQESQSWWSKYIVIVGDELPPSLPASNDEFTSLGNENNTEFEVLFTTKTLGIIAKQRTNCIKVRECVSFPNGEPGPALKSGEIQPDDIILSVNGIPVDTTHQFKTAVTSTTRPVVVRFRRETKPINSGYDLFGENTSSKSDDYNLFGY